MPKRLLALLLVLPALVMIVLFFIVPLFASIVGAFEVGETFGFGNFSKSFELYSSDMIFTVVIVAVSTTLIGFFSIAIGGYLTLGENPRAVALLRWLYRWPMFIPFIVVGQVLRTFLAKNGLMNNILVSLGILTPLQTVGFSRLARNCHCLRLEADALCHPSPCRGHGLA